MLLKSLEIHGFKTFPDKTTLTFNNDIVAVVGPNGSGKSNVSDALRWVLGEQSTKALRCSKMEDVIFKGTTSRKALGYAEVTLNIDNTERRLNFDSDSIAVTRRFYRSGDSEYLLNKASVRLKDINELFMDTGLGRDGYSMIGQGKIDSIVAAKSEERREIFEEASGISKYRYRKEEAERRLNKAEDNLIRLRDILNELYERLGPLKIQAEKAQKFIEYDSEKYGLEIGIWVESLNKFDKLLREYDEKLSIERSQLENKEKEIEDILLKEEENLRKINETAVKIDSERNEISLIDEERVKNEGEILLLNKELSFIENDIERIEKEIAALSLSDAEIKENINNKEILLKNKTEEIEKLKDLQLSVSSESEKNRREAEKLTIEIDLKLKESEQTNKEISLLNQNLYSQETLISEINSRKDSIDELITKNEEKSKELENTSLDLNKKREELLNKKSSLNNSAAGYDLKLNSRVKKAEEYKENYEKLALSASEEARRAKLLEDYERNYEGFQHSVKAILKESERKVLKGVIAPVAKIINTDKEYSIAIETALSGSLQNIVVETERDGKNCLNYLKKNNIGKATFMPVETIRGFVMSDREYKGKNGYIGIASELVSCDKKFENIKNKLLGTTLVAEDIDAATSLARSCGYKHKFVTLDGQQVNSGGSLTGGALAKNSGILSRRSEIERIRKKAEDLKQKSEQILLERKKLDEEVKFLEASKALLNTEIAEVMASIAVTETEIRSNLKEISENEALILSLKEEKGGVKSRTEGINRDIAEFKSKLKEEESKLAKEKSSTDSLMLLRNKLSAEFSEISEKLQEIRMKSFTLNTERDLLEKEIISLKEKITLQKETKEVNRSKIEELLNKIELTKLDIKNKEALVLNKKEASESKKTNITNLSLLRNNLESESVTLRNRERAASSERELLKSEFTRLEERNNQVKYDYENILKKLWDEYEITRNEAEEKAIVIEDLTKAQRRLTELKNKIKALGNVNVGAVVEYKEVSQRYEFMYSQLQDVEKSKQELLKLIGDLTGKMRKQFSLKFEEINNNFKKVFKEMFGGGSATLELSDDSDILNSGIEIKVHPPGKIVSHIEALSGGEKALVAISIYFAIMKVNPPPFCMLDEVEAALDDVNVRKFASFLHSISDNTQFIVVTHRRGTMESADTLYGVTMQDDGVSKVLELKNREEIKQIEADAS
ncbi:MAG: chromosome segregation protein SMC [Ruminococcaceae bacterium]|nr:chromosome segregation protein SMC [Oscillospiraceae bacterium]